MDLFEYMEEFDMQEPQLRMVDKYYMNTEAWGKFTTF